MHNLKTNITQILNDKHNQDFNTALDIYENEYSHNDLISFLKNGTVAQKQAAALKLDTVKTKEEAEIFMSNLTGCDGKIREAVSFRLKEFIPQNPDFLVCPAFQKNCSQANIRLISRGRYAILLIVSPRKGDFYAAAFDRQKQLHRPG